jgi:glucans biosynthesis protein C
MSEQKRIHGLDALRGIAMILGIFLHGAITYKAGFPYGELIHDDQAEFYFFDWFHLFINSFRMQLFFILAGFFAGLMIKKIGTKSFINNRFRRVAIPLAIAYFTILPATLAPVIYFNNRASEPWFHVQQFLADFYSMHFHGLIHLWFLYDLIWFYVAALALCWITKKFFKNGMEQTNTSAFLLQPPVFIGITILLASVISQLYKEPVLTIWTGLITPIPQLLYYGFFFSVGWFIEKHRSLLDHFGRTYKFQLVMAFLLSLANAAILNLHFINGMQPWEGALYRFSLSIQTIFFSFGLIGLFNTVFSASSSAGRYLAMSAFWVYLIHNPIVLTTQVMLVESFVPPVLRFPVVIVVTIILCYTSYHFLVRNTSIGVMLNGKRMDQK